MLDWRSCLRLVVGRMFRLDYVKRPLTVSFKEKRKFQTNTETGRNHKTIYFTFKGSFRLHFAFDSIRRASFPRKLLPWTRVTTPTPQQAASLFSISSDMIATRCRHLESGERVEDLADKVKNSFSRRAILQCLIYRLLRMTSIKRQHMSSEK